MELLLNPNVGYMLLMIGLLMAMLAILSPGTGVLELGALLAILLAGLQMFSVPINLWWVLVILVGAGLFGLAVYRRGDRLILAMSLLIMFVGSALMYGIDGWRLAVNPWLVLVVSLVEGGFIWISVQKILLASAEPPVQDINNLIGRTGETRSDVHQNGTVYVSGDLWSAYSREPIPNNTPIRVIRREGFLLEVEPLTDS